MEGLDGDSVDAIVTDPPYFKFKEGSTWDWQWSKAREFLDWLDRCARQWARLLKPNGSIYVFTSPRMAARIEVMLADHFQILNHIVWDKEQSRMGAKHRAACKEELRSYFPCTERVIFAEHYGVDNAAKGEAGYARKCDEIRGFVFEPLRAYLEEERIKAGVSRADCDVACNVKTFASHHFFSRSQWCLPTRPQYEALQRLFNGQIDRTDNKLLAKDYEHLRREYDDLRQEYEELRRPFAVSSRVPYTDVWAFEPVAAYPGKHPCEKPLDMLEHIVRASTRPGAVVLDCFMGSGNTGLACRRLGRDFIGIEKDRETFEKASDRIIDRLPLFDAFGVSA